MRKGILLLTSVLGLLAASHAPAMTVTYEIGPHTIGSWSGSFVHRASGCSGGSDLDMDGNGSNDTLRMCGGARRVRGSLTGDWDGTTLTNITGSLGRLAVIGGSLGGDYYAEDDGRLKPLWSLDVQRIGTFYFEDMPINQITSDTLTLWGQNVAAYMSCKGCGRRFGLDLYGETVGLAEPRSIAIVLIGLLSMPLVLARRRAARQTR